jgi:hypothetical protein
VLADEDEKANAAQMGNFFNIKKQLDDSDPLVLAINRSKISTLTDQGHSPGLAGAVLKMFDWDLPVAQAWSVPAPVPVSVPDCAKFPIVL